MPYRSEETCAIIGNVAASTSDCAGFKRKKSPVTDETGTVILTLPAYNEEKSLPLLFTRFLEFVEDSGLKARIVIVDDGSTDKTVDVIAEWSNRVSIDVVLHKQNCGLGQTLRDGLKRAFKTAGPRDVIVTMDADNTHPPHMIARMVQLLREGNHLVISSRYRSGARVLGLSRMRFLLSVGARVLFKLVFPIAGVRDYTCGFRAYSVDLLRRAFEKYGDSLIEEDGFQAQAELLLKLSRLGLIATELPLILRYDYKLGVSKMKVFNTVLGTLLLMVKFRFLPMRAESK